MDATYDRSDHGDSDDDLFGENESTNDASAAPQGEEEFDMDVDNSADESGQNDGFEDESERPLAKEDEDAAPYNPREIPDTLDEIEPLGDAGDTALLTTQLSQLKPPSSAKSLSFGLASTLLRPVKATVFKGTLYLLAISYILT